MPNYFPVFLTEDSDLWSYPPRTRKKKRRIRKPTLARAVIEAVEITSALAAQR